MSRAGEQKVEEETLENRIRKDLGVSEDFPIFIPSIVYRKGKRSITYHLMEGYAFVGGGLPESSYFALENKYYINTVMSVTSSKGLRILRTISEREVRTMKRQLRNLVSVEIEIDSSVKVLEGPYANLEGIVVDVGSTEAGVHFIFRSMEAIVYIPKIFLETLDEPLDVPLETPVTKPFTTGFVKKTSLFSEENALRTLNEKDIQTLQDCIRSIITSPCPGMKIFFMDLEHGPLEGTIVDIHAEETGIFFQKGDQEFILYLPKDALCLEELSSSDLE